MARNFNGGTDQIHWYDNAETNGILTETVAFWMRTTQSGVSPPPQVWANWSSGSRSGLAILFNDTANKVTALSYDASLPHAFLITSTTSVNDGNWHHVAVTADRNNGGGNTLYVDGVSEASGNSSKAWNTTGSYYTLMGDSLDVYWASFVGDLAEVAHWADVKLGADEIAALAKGWRPSRIRPESLDHYAPLVREVPNIISPTKTSPAGVSVTTGTTATDHPRTFG